MTTSQVSLPSQIGATGRDGVQHCATSGFAVCQSEQQADAEIDPVEQHVEQNADGQKRDPEHDHCYSPAMTQSKMLVAKSDSQSMNMAILPRRRGWVLE